MNFTDLDKETQAMILESNKKSDLFLSEYRKLHECCPKCGETSHCSTLVGYILNMDNLEDYKDLNKCTCIKCDDVHTTHERVPI